MIARVDCEGAPRDLGLDQGRACRDAIRADVRAARPDAREPAPGGLGSGLSGALARLRAALREPVSPGLARDLARHFPHLDERTAGLAAGSGLSHDALVALLARELAAAPPPRVGIGRGQAGPQVALELAAPLPPTGLVVRDAKPDGGHRNLTLARPGLVAALAGVNEQGLAGAVAPLAPPAGSERCRAPGALLLEGCLERLDTVEKALEWCERRPGGGHALVVLADATGACAAIAIEGDARRRLDAPILAGGGQGAGALARMDPAARTLEVVAAGGAPERFELPAA